MVVEEALDNAHVEKAFEAFLKRSKLALTLLSELKVNVKSDELTNVLLGDKDIGAAFLKLALGYFTELLHIGRESAAHGFFKRAHLGLIPAEHDFERRGRFRLPLAQVVQV